MATEFSAVSLILTSAGVAAIVSSVATLLGQKWERRARRDEAMLATSLELARRKSDQVIQAAKATGRPYRIADPIVQMEIYYEWLQHLIKHGKLPADPRIARYEDRDYPPGARE